MQKSVTHGAGSSRAVRLDDDPPQSLDLLGNHDHVAGVQDRRVVATKSAPDLLQTRALQHLKAQQHGDMAGQHESRQATSAG